MTDKAKASFKRFGFIAAGLAVIGVLQWQFNIIPVRASREAVVPTSVELKTESDVQQTRHEQAEAVALPTSTATKAAGPTIRVNMYAWTAQLGLIFANGGTKTTEGSLMEKNGVKVQLIAQSDLNKSQASQIKFANSVAEGNGNPADGAHFVVMMGDGAAQYLAGINKATEKLGPEYRAEIVGAVGYSGNDVSGEDACMGPAEWQDDPAKAAGSLISGYLRDGDWNLCLYWMNQNGIKNNPDETTFDPTAVNWLSTDDHLKAAEAYISGYCEERKVVENGKVTNKPKQRVCVQGVATWTPGDVNIAKKKGGLVKLISTRENKYQMPAVVIGIHKWNVEHSKLVQSFLKAAFEGSDQVRSFDAALNRAGKAAAEVYGEENGAYWVRYYRGLVEQDRTGRKVPLGGSRVANLGDNLVLFGIADGSGDLNNSIWRASYEGFGNVAKQQYPTLVPSFPSVIEATNTTFLQNLATTSLNKTASDSDTFTPGATVSEIIAKREYNITFDTGKATFKPEALPVLNDIYNQIVVGKLAVDIVGHTDNVGDSTLNRNLSEARARAVETFLSTKAPALFQTGRVSVAGKGDTQPVAPNVTAEGRARNRRVTIVLGNK